MPPSDISFPAAPVTLKIGVSVGIGMLVGLEREWSNKDMGVRTFAIVSLFGMLASLVGQPFIIAGLIGVLLLGRYGAAGRQFIEPLLRQRKYRYAVIRNGR